jgi:hypothetical protein
MTRGDDTIIGRSRSTTIAECRGGEQNLTEQKNKTKQNEQYTSSSYITNNNNDKKKKYIKINDFHLYVGRLPQSPSAHYIYLAIRSAYNNNNNNNNNTIAV